MEDAQIYFLGGYEAALEKVGFHEPEIMDFLIKAAAGGKAGAVKRVGEAASKALGIERPIMNIKGPAAAAKPPMAKVTPKQPPPMARQIPAEAQLGGIPESKIREQLMAGRQAEQLAQVRGQRIGEMQKGPVGWFQGQSPVAQAAMLGGGALGTLGLGAGLGHAMTSKD